MGWSSGCNGSSSVASYILGLGHRDLAATKHTINDILQQAFKLLTLIVRFVRNVLGRLSQTNFCFVFFKETEPLKLIHSNLCCLIPTQIPSGNGYFLTFYT